MHYKSKLLEWVLSRYENPNEQDVREIVPNIKQALVWCYEIWTEMDHQIIKNCWRMSKILPLTWNANFATKDEREKHRLQ